MGKGRQHERGLLIASLGLAALAAVAWFCAAPAAADTYITESGTDFLYTINASGSPFILGHDFEVRTGGALFIGAGAELQVENGSRIIGNGGEIILQGSTSSVAVLRGRPGAAAPSLAAIELNSGSELTLLRGLLENGTALITANSGSSVLIQGSQLRLCGQWCLNTGIGSAYDVSDTSFGGGVWGVIDNGTNGGRFTNVTLDGFTAGAIQVGSHSVGAHFNQTTITNVDLGARVESALTTQFNGVEITSGAGPALEASSPIDLLVTQSHLSSLGGTAVNVSYSSRFSLAFSTVEGSAGSLRLLSASAPLVRNNTLSSSAGPCLDMPGATGGLLSGNLLTGCSESLHVGRGQAPPNVTADSTNLVEGRPFLWLRGGSSVTVNASGDPGLVVMVNVAGLNISDLSLRSSGLFLFGCSGVVVERLRVSMAHAGITAVDVRGLTVRELVAQDVQYGVELWGTSAQDILIDHVHVVAASNAAVSIEQAANVSIVQAMAEGGVTGIELIDVQGAFLDRVLVRGAVTGLFFDNASGVTLVGSVLDSNVAVGALVTGNSTGVASRNAFLNNVLQASAPANVGFQWNETGGGNYWSDFLGPDANGDGWADVPYVFPDATGTDYRARVVRYDFGPTAIINVSGRAEIGAPFTFDGSFSFDDFAVDNVYWAITFPNDTANGEGPTFVWTANRTGDHTVTVSAVGSLGATDDYTFVVRVIDTTAPTFTGTVSGRPEAGGNATIVLNASDNDLLFPAGVYITWRLEPPTGLMRTGTATNLTFLVPVDVVGNHTLRLTLADAAGNTAQGTLLFTVQDTVPPDIVVHFEGDPALAEPFALDASESFDPSGISPTSANWTWTEEFAVRSVTGWPLAEITFAHLGTYNVTVHVCDILSNCASRTYALTVLDKRGPVLVRVHVNVPNGDTLDVTPGAPQVVNAKSGDTVAYEIFAQDAGGAVTFDWDFGDGTTANGSSVVHRFERSGDFSVVIKMTDPSGNVNVTAVRMHVEQSGLLGGFIPAPPAVPALAAAALLMAAAGALRARRRR